MFKYKMPPRRPIGSKPYARGHVARQRKGRGRKALKAYKNPKGAYGKRAKKNMAIRRAPFVETKRRVHSLITALNANADGTPSANYHDTINGLLISNVTAFTLLDLASYYRNSHGFNERNVIGDTLYSKWLKLKITLKFPTGTDMIVNPVKMFLITGWVTAPMALTNNTTVTEGNATKQTLIDHLDDQLREYFDERQDFLRFREKTTSNVRILSYKSLMPNNNAAIAAPAAQAILADDTVRTVGAVPDVNRTFTWSTKRKVHLSEGKAVATSTDASDPDIQNLFPNNQWLPFAIIYNKDHASMRNAADEDTKCQLFYNDIHHFSDS